MATISELIESGKELADMVESDFVEDPVWLSWANQAYKRLYTMLATMFAENFIGPPVEVTLDSSGVAPLPADFLMLRGVDRRAGSGCWDPLKKFNFASRSSRASGHGYRVVGTNLLIDGLNIAGSYRIWYIAQPESKVIGYTIEPELQLYEEWIALEIAIKALGKEETPFNHLLKLQKLIEDQMETASKNRDIGGVDRVADVRGNRWDHDFDDPELY